MTSELLILRPEPGASKSAAFAGEKGWRTVKLPLFAVTSIAWNAAPADRYDAVMMTSANAALFGGANLVDYAQLPLYAVGERTAEMAHEAGFHETIAGDGGAAELADRLRADGKVRILHLAGAATRPFDETGLLVDRVTVYEAIRTVPPDLGAALASQPIILIHSPRSGGYLDELARAQGIDRAQQRIVAISPAALAAAGQGWGAARAADRPDEAAMLDCASALGESDPIG